MDTETAEMRARAEAWLVELDEAALARLRERWPADGSGEGPRDLAVLEGTDGARPL